MERYIYKTDTVWTQDAKKTTDTQTTKNKCNPKTEMWTQQIRIENDFKITLKNQKGFKERATTNEKEVQLKAKRIIHTEVK